MRIIFTILGIVFAAIGAIGVVIPVMPTTPFLLLAAAFLAKGSKRFNDWFINSKLYKNNLENFIKTGGMTVKEKRRILLFASSMLIIAFFLCPPLIGKVVILAVIAIKYYVFLFRIKTIDSNANSITQIEEKISEVELSKTDGGKENA